ncbi:MAG: tetratricopeptide repeat protein [Vicinamibacterales bacterium]
MKEHSVRTPDPDERPSRDEICEALARVCASRAFGPKAKLPRVLLEHIVCKTLEGRWDELKGIYIRRTIFGDLEDSSESVVQVAVSDLRDRLTRHYSAEGNVDPIVIEVPLAKRGFGYRATFRRNTRGAQIQRVALSLSELLGRSIAVETIVQRLDSRSTNVDAHVRFMQGIHLAAQRTPEGYAKALDYFHEALRLDPGYARAHAGIAECLCSSAIFFESPLVVLPRAERAARTAIESDSSIWEAHAAIGMVRMCLNWDWRGAAAAFSVAHGLSPDGLSLHLWHTVYLVAVGRDDDAIRNYERALLLQPAAVQVNTILTACLLACRRYAEAEMRVQSAIDLAPSQHQPRLYLMMVQLATGRHDSALDTIHGALDCVSQPTKLLGFRALCEAVSGRRDEAVATLGLLHDAARHHYIGAVQFALAYQGLGELDDALAWMSRACDERDPLMVWLHRWPILDPMRGHPRFEELVHKMRPEASQPPTPRDRKRSA